MTSRQLLRHLDWMASGGVKVVPLVELLDASDEDAIALTFDDGLTNFGEISAPMLAERGLPATVFIAPAQIGTWNSWDDNNRPTIPKLSLMSWDEIRSLSEQGFDIGGHGQTHISLSGLTLAQVTGEVETCSKRILEETGKKPRSFAYPYGHFDQNAIDAVSKVFDFACTAEHRPISPGDSQHVLPRLDMYYFKDVPINRMWGTPLFNAYVKLRAAGRALRATLGVGA